MKNYLKYIIVFIVLTIVIGVTACTTTPSVEGFEKDTFVFNYMDSEYGFKCYVMTDKDTGVEYIVLEKEGNGNYPITMTPRMQTNELVKYNK